ncbi:hypothetical protein [Deefgea sp. CFH1-16]|uniref:hypothetical protein n=1 Tax=Deefgea sp. CFH1-16 TaxID=2675457 RepID=UPI0015F63B81|nr:hypothetical protein [Deefgea sp. CFH1-16]MBM5574981.1 hypothetical protein [Deefgea sp. CFH1-16]
MTKSANPVPASEKEPKNAVESPATPAPAAAPTTAPKASTSTARKPTTRRARTAPAKKKNGDNRRSASEHDCIASAKCGQSQPRGGD